MKVFVNGSSHDIAEDTSLSWLLDQVGIPESGVAVAVDGDVVRRAQWAETVVREGMRIEIITAVQGG